MHNLDSIPSPTMALAANDSLQLEAARASCNTISVSQCPEQMPWITQGPLALSALTFTPALTYPSNNFDTVDCTEVIGKAVGKVPSAGRSGTQLPRVQSSCAMMYKKLHRHISFTTARSIYLAFADTVIAPKVKRLSGACLRREPTRPTPR